MASKTEILKQLGKSFPKIKDYQIDDLSWEILNYYLLFESEAELLLCALIKNPYASTINLSEIEKDFSKSVAKKIKMLQKMDECNNKVITNHLTLSKLIILHLVIVKTLFTKDSLEAKKYLRKKQLEYSQKLLSFIYVSKLRDEMEDLLFAKIHPKTYRQYKSLFKLTKQTYKQKEKEIKRVFRKMLKDSGIDGDINSRTKSIYSMHQKIIKKNLLLSQILDRIGVRIILKSQENCYRLMALISNTWPIFNNKIKDYISVPKNNEYQSIHLTVLYDDQTPVEIQIRTIEMHSFAEYGNACHFEYKEKQ